MSEVKNAASLYRKKPAGEGNGVLLIGIYECTQTLFSNSTVIPSVLQLSEHQLSQHSFTVLCFSNRKGFSDTLL